MDKVYTILTLSPGSTSTKVAVFRNEEQIFKSNITHEPEKLKSFAEIQDQFDYRLETVTGELEKANIKLEDIDAFAAYSGALVATVGGVYPVNDKMLEHSRMGLTAKHPAMLGAQIIYALAQVNGKPAYVINHPDVDELQDLARVTGIPGVYRQSKVHCLNQKETAHRAAAELGIKYEDGNFIVAHVGGGLSVAAHQKGMMVDTNDVINGSGPMAPNRSGNVPAGDIIKMCFSGKYTQKEMTQFVSKTGGLLGHLDTDNTRIICQKVAEGDKKATLIYDAMAYQTAKEIGAFAAVMEGKVDAIVLTGGVSNDPHFVGEVSKRVSWIAPIKVYGGDFEMEALAAGAIRALEGEEPLREYTGIPVWSGFDF